MKKLLICFVFIVLTGCAAVKPLASEASSAIAPQTTTQAVVGDSAEESSDSEKAALAEAAGAAGYDTSNATYRLVDNVLYMGDSPVDTDIDELELRNVSFDDYSFLRDFKNLHRLTIESSPITSEDLEYLENMDDLYAVYLILCENITSLDALANLPALEELYMIGSHISDFSPLKKAESLNTLYLDMCPQLSDISFLENLPSLVSLSLTSCENISDFSVLSNLNMLTVLNLSWTSFSDADIPYLMNMNHMEDLSLFCENVDNYALLAGLDAPNMKYLACQATEDELIVLKETFPNCEISVPIIEE
jgi:hypothetical protein